MFTIIYIHLVYFGILSAVWVVLCGKGGRLAFCRRERAPNFQYLHDTHTLKMYNEVPRTFVPFCTFHLLFYMHLCLKPSDGHGGLRVCIPVQPSDGPGLASQCGQTLAQGPPEFPVLRSTGSKHRELGRPLASVWPFFLYSKTAGRNVLMLRISFPGQKCLEIVRYRI